MWKGLLSLGPRSLPGRYVFRVGKFSCTMPIMDENATRLAPPKGIAVFGMLLILSSLMHMLKLVVERQVYAEYYAYLPAWLLTARYSFSWFQRLCGILAGAGILARKELARKLALAIGWFTLATVYWKHPYPAVKVHVKYIDPQFGYFISQIGVPLSTIVLLSVVGLILCDAVFWGIFLYYFSRPSVKRQFTPRA